MLISCRPSSYNKFVVSWIKYGRVINPINMRSMLMGVNQKKEFNNYADAAGFHSSLLKRGVSATLKRG